nr:uncharacterized protein LOC109187603 [Ipomoea trifida]
MSEGTKLYMNKPKKSQLKQKASSTQTPSSSSSSSMASSTSTAATKPAPPAPPAKEPFLRRYRFMLPMLLAVNLSIGAYLYMRTKNKDPVIEMEEVPSAPVVTSTESTKIAEKLVTPPVVQPVMEPISDNDKREIFKWILEEKRKLKPKDPEEKRRIDEEKAILKQFIRAKSIPSL